MDGMQPTVRDAPPRPRRRAAIVVAVVLTMVVAIPTVVALAFTTDDGAGTPEGAVQQLADAVVARDARAILLSLPPGERDAITPYAAPMVTELQRLGLVGPVGISAAPGFDVHIDGLVMRSTPVDDHLQDLVAVDVVGGTLSGSFDRETSVLTDSARKTLDDVGLSSEGNPAGTFSRDFSRDPLSLVTLREGGGWHVSLFYTVADALRTEHRLPRPRIGEAPDASGADTPDAAVRDLFKTWGDNDARRAVTLTDPSETRALYDYAPLFLLASQRTGRRNDDEGMYKASVRDLTYRLEGSGGVRKATITSLEAEMGGLVSTTRISYDGRCFRQEERWEASATPYATSVACGNDSDGRAAGARRPRTNPFSMLAIFGGGSDLPTVTVEENQGRWFVSPARSLLDSTVATLRSMAPGDVDGFVQNVRASATAVDPWLHGDTTQPWRADAAAPIVASATVAAPGAERFLQACAEAALVDQAPQPAAGSWAVPTRAERSQPPTPSDVAVSRARACVAQQEMLGHLRPGDVVWL